MRDHTTVYQLFVLNLALQLFDGIATYEGLRMGCGEANPLLLSIFPHLGVGLALLIFKAKACLLLVFLLWQRRHPAVPWVLVFLACIYELFSFIPWSVKFAGFVV